LISQDETSQRAFKKYVNGILDDAGVEVMNRQLIEIYFISPGDLSQEETEYTEDLVIELYTKNLLEEKYALRLKERMEEEKTLQKKYFLIKELQEASSLFRRSVCIIWPTPGQRMKRKRQSLRRYFRKSSEKWKLKRKIIFKEWFEALKTKTRHT